MQRLVSTLFFRDCVTDPLRKLVAAVKRALQNAPMGASNANV